MYGMLITPSDPHWTYEDPSGIPDEVAVAVRMPETLAHRVQAAAAREGVTPSGWLLELVARALSSHPTAA
jgi:hypothetical protein